MKKNWVVLFASFGALVILNTACLKTRSQVSEEDEKKIIQSQVTQLQRTKADQDANLQTVENQMRMLYGRIETLEFQVNQLSSEKEALNKKIQENDERFKQLEQALLMVEQGQTVALKPASAATPETDEPTVALKKEGKKARTTFDEAEDLFNQKQWKKAVVLYQKFREKNPTGPEAAAATLKIGMCFQEMKLNKEARVFYEEVLEKHPKSKLSKTAQLRLKELSKKK